MAAGCTDYIKNPGYDWNNAWFASQGFVTLNYTPRGWFDSCGKDSSTGYSYASDPACSGGSFTDPDCGRASQQSWVHLYDRRWEVRDAQYHVVPARQARFGLGRSAGQHQ